MDYETNRPAVRSKCISIWRVIMITALFCFSGQAFTQSGIPDPALNPLQTSVEIDSFLLRLPPIEQLIDSAIAHASILKGQDLAAQVNDLDIRHTRRSWTNDIINAGGVFSYGRFNDLYLNNNLGPTELATNSTAQTRYSLGVTVKIPIIAFFDRYEYKKAQIEMERTKNFRDILIQQIREELYSRYNSLLTNYQAYRILFENFADQEIILQNAEKDFLNNQAAINEISSIRISCAKAKIDLNRAKYEFEKSLWMLEEYVGFSIW